MNKHLAWYLVELERELKGSLHTDEVQRHLAEVEGHLQESALAIQELDGYHTDPMEEAVRMFGSPREVAGALVQSKRGTSAELSKKAILLLSLFATLAIPLEYSLSFLPIQVQGVLVGIISTIMQLTLLLLAMLGKRKTYLVLGTWLFVAAYIAGELFSKFSEPGIHIRISFLPAMLSSAVVYAILLFTGEWLGKKFGLIRGPLWAPWKRKTT